MKRNWGWIFFAGVAAVAGGLAYFGIIPFPGHHTPAHAEGAKPAAKVAAPVVVTVAPVTARTVERKVSIVGSLYGREEITIMPKVEGRIAKILRDVGDVVAPGEVLAAIDDTDFKLAVTEAKRGLEMELAKLGLTAPPGDDFNVDKLPAVMRARALVKNSETEWQRFQRLGKAISQEEHERAETNYQVAVANERQTILEAQATIAAVQYRQALVATAEQRLADTKIVVPQVTEFTAHNVESGRGGHAPITAANLKYKVAERSASEGEMLRNSPNSSMNVFKLVIDDPLEMHATVPERNLGQIEVGQRVDVQVEAYPGEVFPGEVTRVNPTVDRANRTFQVEVTVANKHQRLSAGCFAKAQIYTRVDRDAITVPEGSLVYYAGVTKLFVLRDGQADEVQVTPGVRLAPQIIGGDEAWVEVAGGVAADDQVITSGLSQLADGKPVQLRAVVK